MPMPISISGLNPEYIVYAGVTGICFGILLLLLFLYRRMLWIVRTLSGWKLPAPGLLSSLGKLILITLWTSCFGLLLFLGFFLRSYHVFTYEKPVAEIRVQMFDVPQKGPIALIHLSSPHIQSPRLLIIKGDQWMVEGDILKWENWLTFLGLETRYRLTRIRGRYLSIDAETKKQHTIHSLVPSERDPLWRSLYRYGQQVPFINTVYGSAVFQDLGEDKTYLIFVGTSGFMAREKV
ncbi:MAG: hypothetical protein ABII26_03120 [Pseudomonadota bacterium]